MKKNLITILMAAAMALCLCSCGSTKSTTTAASKAASEAASAAESAVSEAASAAESAVSEAASAAESAVSEAASAAESAVSEAASAAESAVSEAASAAESAVSEAASAAESASDEASEAASSGDDTVYTFNFASPNSEDNLRFIYLEKAVVDLITEKSGGRIQFVTYPSASLANTGAIMQGCIDGICDIGVDASTIYPGVYLYNELMGTPGLYIGADLDEKTENQRAYSLAFTAAEYESKGLKLLAEVPTMDLCILTNEPINSVEDFAARSVGTTPNQMVLFDSFGASVTNVIMSEYYESMRLGVVDTIFNGLGLVDAFRLYEVANYAYQLPITYGNITFVMSMKAYNSLPADLQAVIDEIAMSDEVLQFNKDFINAQLDLLNQHIAEGNPDFEYVELSQDIIDAMADACTETIEAKVAELNAAGLDGDGAYELIKSFSK